MERHQLKKKTIPANLEQALFTTLHTRSNDFGDVRKINDFRDAIKRGYQPKYTPEEASTFCYLYFGANFLKVEKAIESFAILSKLKAQKIRVLDIGCGSGASSAAVLHALKKISKHVNQFEFVGVDNNLIQLQLYEDIFCRWSKRFQHIKTKSVLADAKSYLANNIGKFDIIICSYLLIENSKYYNNDILKKLYKAAQSGATVLVIDLDPRNKLTKAWLLGKKDIDLPDSFEIVFKQLHSLSPDCCPKYCAHSITKDKIFQIPSVLNRYFLCWTQHDLADLLRLFAPNASYHINGRRILQGIREIEAYWKKNSVEQRNFEHEIHNVLSSNLGIVANWTSSFVRIDKNQIYYIHGIIWITLNSGKITELHEYYTKNVFSLLKINHSLSRS